MSPRENQCWPRRSRGWHWFSRGGNFPCYPLMQSIFIILYWMLIKYIIYITFKTIQIKWIFEFVFRTLKIQMLIQYQSESMVNRTRINSALSIYFCQVPSRVRAWFHDSAGDIDFYQMSLSQSESTILHESII